MVQTIVANFCVAPRDKTSQLSTYEMEAIVMSYQDEQDVVYRSDGPTSEFLNTNTT